MTKSACGWLIVVFFALPSSSIAQGRAQMLGQRHRETQEWQQLPLERRDRIEKNFKRFQGLSVTDQERIRHRWDWFHALPESRREEIIEHLRSRPVRPDFQRHRQDILRDAPRPERPERIEHQYRESFGDRDHRTHH